MNPSLIEITLVFPSINIKQITTLYISWMRMVVKIIEILIIVTCKSSNRIFTIIGSQSIASELVRTSIFPFLRDFTILHIRMIIVYSKLHTIRIRIVWIDIKTLLCNDNSSMIAVIWLWNTISMEREPFTLYAICCSCVKGYGKRSCLRHNFRIICHTCYRSWCSTNSIIKKSLFQYMSICTLRIGWC